jgi:hypothetical protein
MIKQNKKTWSAAFVRVSVFGSSKMPEISLTLLGMALFLGSAFPTQPRPNLRELITGNSSGLAKHHYHQKAKARETARHAQSTQEHRSALNHNDPPANAINASTCSHSEHAKVRQNQEELWDDISRGHGQKPIQLTAETMCRNASMAKRKIPIRWRSQVWQVQTHRARVSWTPHYKEDNGMNPAVPRFGASSTRITLPLGGNIKN